MFRACVDAILKDESLNQSTISLENLFLGKEWGKQRREQPLRCTLVIKTMTSIFYVSGI